MSEEEMDPVTQRLSHSDVESTDSLSQSKLSLRCSRVTCPDNEVSNSFPNLNKINLKSLKRNQVRSSGSSRSCMGPTETADRSSSVTQAIRDIDQMPLFQVDEPLQLIAHKSKDSLQDTHKEDRNGNHQSDHHCQQEVRL